MQRNEASTDRRTVAKRDRGDRLAELAYRVHRLCPDHRNPHRFHEEKSEIAHELRTLADQVKPSTIREQIELSAAAPKGSA